MAVLGYTQLPSLTGGNVVCVRFYVFSDLHLELIVGCIESMCHCSVDTALATYFPMHSCRKNKTWNVCLCICACVYCTVLSGYANGWQDWIKPVVCLACSLFHSSQEPAEPANTSPQKSWGKKDSFALLWLSLLACSCFMIEFIFLGSIFSVMSDSGLKEGFCFQMPFA